MACKQLCPDAHVREWHGSVGTKMCLRYIEAVKKSATENTDAASMTGLLSTIAYVLIKKMTLNKAACLLSVYSLHHPR
jgi:hypothetical protein